MVLPAALAFALALLAVGAAPAAPPPVLPVGWDAITHGLELWPHQRLGVRAMVRSTFDRSGANEAADSSHYLYYNRSTGAARAVAMSLEGTRGCLYFCRFNHVWPTPSRTHRSSRAHC